MNMYTQLFFSETSSAQLKIGLKLVFDYMGVMEYEVGTRVSKVLERIFGLGKVEPLKHEM